MTESKVDLKKIFDELNFKYFENKLYIRKLHIVPSLTHVHYEDDGKIRGIGIVYAHEKNDLLFNPEQLKIDPEKQVFIGMSIVASFNREKYNSLLKIYEHHKKT